MKTFNTFATIAMVSLLSAAGCQSSGQKSCCSDTGGKRVGTFRRADIVVAYYNSTMHAEHLRELKAERDAALADGDKERAEALSRRGGEMQKLAHQQLAGNAPLDNIMERMGLKVFAIKQEANVTAIVEESEAPKGATTVDVTKAMLAELTSARKKR